MAWRMENRPPATGTAVNVSNEEFSFYFSNIAKMVKLPCCICSSISLLIWDFFVKRILLPFQSFSGCFWLGSGSKMAEIEIWVPRNIFQPAHHLSINLRYFYQILLLNSIKYSNISLTWYYNFSYPYCPQLIQNQSYFYYKSINSKFGTNSQNYAQDCLIFSNVFPNGAIFNLQNWITRGICCGEIIYQIDSTYPINCNCNFDSNSTTFQLQFETDFDLEYHYQPMNSPDLGNIWEVAEWAYSH